jgi:phosphomannomutase
LKYARIDEATVSESLIISVSGIRGIVGQGLTPDVVARYAAAHGAERRAATGLNTIVVGRDSRISGPMLQTAAMAGLQSVGCDVIDIGLACTPTILLAIEREAAAGGIAVTASHNPAEWNALKLASEKGMFLTPDEAEKVRACVERDRIPFVAWDELGSITVREGATRAHIKAILADPLVDTKAVWDRGFKVVVDGCAGAGGRAARPLLDALGVSIDGLHLQPTGWFPREPEPVAANLGELTARVRDTDADLGFAIDPDGDRLALVDETGAPVGEDMTLALTVDYVLGELAVDGQLPRPVVTNVSTSQIVDRAAEIHGATVERTPVGEVNVALRMAEIESPIGGEGNGGVIYPPLHLTRDASVAMALILSYLARKGRSLSEAVERFPEYTIHKTKVWLSGVHARRLLERAAVSFEGAEQDETDGLKLIWPERQEWVQLRQSGTEPVVRVIAEAPDAMRAKELVKQARDLAGDP